MDPVVLATIDGNSPAERLVLSLIPCELEGQFLELQRQSWCESLGWFTQSRTRIHREEINELRSALGTISGKRRRAGSPFEQKVLKNHPQILQFPSQHSA
jgi:hypothetical protein